jgi:hypothetical protein
MLKRHEESGTRPAFDISVLLRQGHISGERYGEIVRQQKRPAYAGTVKCDITIGDMLTALATPEQSKQRAMEQHAASINFIELLLRAKEGQRFEMPALPPEVHNALLGLSRARKRGKGRVEHAGRARTTGAASGLGVLVCRRHPWLRARGARAYVFSAFVAVRQESCLFRMQSHKLIGELLAMEFKGLGHLRTLSKGHRAM